MPKCPPKGGVRLQEVSVSGGSFNHVGIKGSWNNKRYNGGHKTLGQTVIGNLP